VCLFFATFFWGGGILNEPADVDGTRI